MNLADKESSLYATAYGLYSQGDYQGAEELFLQLVLLNAFEEKHWRGLASSHQMQRKYQDAAYAWSLVALLCDSDPYPHFHAAECLLSLKEKEDGLKALLCAEERLSEAQQDLRDKIEVLRSVA
jgi:type III secretion system low calcium response chaperone LcrH/SycD